MMTMLTASTLLALAALLAADRRKRFRSRVTKTANARTDECNALRAARPRQ